MHTENRNSLPNAQKSQWPVRPILFWGTFGTKSPAERRYLMRACLAMIVAAGWILVMLNAPLNSKSILLPISAVLAGSVITFIAWELRRYLLQLDELARRLQLEAIAYTYLTGFVLAAWMGVLAPFSHTLMHWPYKPGFLLLSPFLYFLLEPIRSGWLYYLSRRY